MRLIEYNRFAAVNYAREWALKRNPNYYDFEKIGGDCTNFSSQCIFAGSKVMNFTPVMGWYYRSLSDRTPSWSGVEYLYDFLVKNKSVGPYGREVSENEVLPGDIVQLGRSNGDFYHTPVIVSVTPNILLAAHTYDTINKPLDEYYADKVRFIHIEGVRIW